ncbi:MAG: 16S rRNA (cytosine(1402)-N(4))-methyltransferase RsmH [Longimicrobiales bacterium]
MSERRGASRRAGGGAEYHAPVMVEEVLEYLAPERGGDFFDGTVGGGGHAEAILEAGPDARLIGADRDPEALAVARERLLRFGERVRLELAGFAEAAARVAVPLAGALLDLGVSSHQIDALERGFSFREGAPLDMRMGGAGAERATAAELLNTLPEAELQRIFREYGEERRWRALAREIVRRRGHRRLETSDDLVAVLFKVRGPRTSAQDKARIFQAVRIAVNQEIEQLDLALALLLDRLGPGGVFVILSYHSLEDRRVKQAFRDWSRDCVCPPELPVCGCRGVALGETLTRRPRRPGESECAANPRARSARLRAWRKAA